MREVWLRPNRRALLANLILPGLLLAAGVPLLLGWPSGAAAARIGGGVLVLFSAAIAANLMRQLRSPRLAFEDGHLVVFLGTPRPIRVPVDLVECFFRGQGPALLAGDDDDETETANVIVRLAEAAPEWHHQSVSRSLGHWCEGYITIRGTWCEPINRELIGRLNSRLVHVHRELRRREQQERSVP